jgi:hypothetical protein
MGDNIHYKPVWTFNGTEGAMGSSPYFSTEVLSSRQMAFCA